MRGVKIREKGATREGKGETVRVFLPKRQTLFNPHYLAGQGEKETTLYIRNYNSKQREFSRVTYTMPRVRQLGCVGGTADLRGME